MDKFLEQFEEIVLAHQKDVINFHYRLVGNRFEAEDLAQETFIKAYKKLATVQDQNKMRSWLLSIARNVTIDFFRKNKNHAIALDENILEYYAQATSVDSREEILSAEKARELQDCIGQLSEQDQTIVRLLYYEGFSYKEIASLLKVNQNTLKSRLHRARAELLKVIQSKNIVSDASPSSV